MQLPGAGDAVIEPRKLRDYLLSASHPVGRYKAAFFTGLGYSQGSWGTLSTDLRAHAIRGDAKLIEGSSFGRKFEVFGRLRGPQGQEADILSVWIILEGEEFPRFVTAYPKAKP